MKELECDNDILKKSLTIFAQLQEAGFLEKMGAQVEVSNYFDRDTLSAAVKGGKNIFLLTPENPASKNFIEEVRTLTDCYHTAIKSSKITK